ncbi:Nucleus export protein [Lachnellula hyalina]|uniref:Nucleus export protein n=1 Tax=Lachnellula hyalina TaxID=1316788 RepID=A0A8H8R4T0_9HELO|nr:Nucleus export protein [Lachnellula hyalina]TVY28592.1 Nucleus export protein [Lachnellula hyalina]
MFNNIGNQRRTHESPMDWEWQTKGPTDPNSPFPQFKPQPGLNSNFESPKPSSSFINSSSTPATPFRNPSFTTPRKPFDPELFSEASGAESSPADNADAEDTPDAQKASMTMAAFTGGSEKKQLFGRYGASFLGYSPGRAEQRRGKYGNALAQKVRKRKRMERDYSVVKSHRDDWDSDSDSGGSRPTSKGKDEKKPGWISEFLNGIESRPNLPNLLSFYTQLGFNLFLLGLTVFGIYTFWTAVRADVDNAAGEARAEVMAEIGKCARDYVDNRCGPDMRLPALENVCNAWALCMNRDPNSVGRAKVSAHTFAQIFNSFIEPISYKAMIFVVLLVTVCIVANNLAFGMFRSSKPSTMPTAQPYYPPTPGQNFQWGAPPQTPQHNIGYDQWGGQTFQAIMPSHTPSHRSPSKGSRSPSKGNRSPSKGDRDRSPSKGEMY